MTIVTCHRPYPNGGGRRYQGMTTLNEVRPDATGTRYLTTEDVATLLRTSPATVRYWRHQGTGPVGVKVGRKVLYDSKAVHAWLAAKQWAERCKPRAERLGA